MHTVDRPFRLSRLALALGFMACGAAHAAWETVPEIALFAAADDNALRETDDDQNTSSAGLDTAIALSNFGQRGTATIRPRIITYEYAGERAQEFESTDKFFDADGAYRWRRIGVGFRSEFSSEAALRTEFTEAEPGGPDDDPDLNVDDPDTGRAIYFSETRDLFFLRGNLDLQLSDRNDLRVEASRQDVAYTGAITDARSDFDNNTLSLAIIRRVDDRNRITARVVASDYFAFSNLNETSSLGVEGLFTRRIAETWSLNVQAGVLRSEYAVLTAPLVRSENAATNYTYRVGVSKRAQRTDWNLSLSHRTQPNSSGYLVVRDEIRAAATHRFTPRLVGVVGLRANTSKTLDDIVTRNDRDYLRFEMDLEWAIKETLFLGVGYDRTQQKFVNEDNETALSNTLNVSVTYRGRSRQPAPN